MKEKLKKYLVRWLVMTVIIVLILIFSGILLGKSQIMNNLDYSINLNEDGSIEVIENWDIYISHTNTLFRTFELNNKFGKIQNVQIKDLETGKNLTQIYQEMYHVTTDCYYALNTSSHEFEVAWGTGMENNMGRKKYQFSYTVTDVITDYKDCQEFYWKLLDDSNGIPVKKVTGTIKLPKSVKNIDNLKVWGHGPLNGDIKIDSNNTVKFNVKNFTTRKMLEIRIVTTEDMFNVNTNKLRNYRYLDKIINEETQWAEESNNSSITFYIIISIIYIIVFIINIFRSIKYNKISKNKDNGIIHTNLEYYRDIPRENEATPSEAAYLYYYNKDISVSMSHQSDFVAATILDLCLKKYISLRIQEKEVYIKILKEGKDLKKDEFAVYRLLNEAGKGQEEFEIGTIQTFAKKRYTEYSALINKVVNEARESLYREKLVDKAQEREYKKSKNAGKIYTFLNITIQFILIGFLIGLIPIFDRAYINMFGIGYKPSVLTMTLILAPIIVSILVKLKIQSRIQDKIAVLTQKGTEEQEQWKALANYIKEFSLLNEKEIPSLVIWEKYLVYATAFGIADKAIEQMKAKYPEVFIKEYWEDENQHNYEILRFATNNIVYNINTNQSPISSLRSNADKAYHTSLAEIAAHQTSSGSGGGGGFSGGGRRPVVAEAGMGRKIKVKILNKKDELVVGIFKK